MNVYSGLVALYMHFDINSCKNIIEYFAVTCLAQELRDLVSALHVKVSPTLPLDPIKTFYSFA